LEGTAHRSEWKEQYHQGQELSLLMVTTTIN
jgi:hypothetical protein